MKKNGYTLVELILTIGLLATASTIILVNMVGIKDNQEKQNSKKFEEAVSSAACAYIDMLGQTELRKSCKSSGCNIQLSTLISDSVALVDPELKDPATNCTAEKEQSRIYVRITFPKTSGIYEKKCEFKRTSEVVCP